MVQYYWSAIVGTERSIGFAALMRQEGFSSSAVNELYERIFRLFSFPLIPDSLNRARTHGMALSEPFVGI